MHFMYMYGYFGKIKKLTDQRDKINERAEYLHTVETEVISYICVALIIDCVSRLMLFYFIFDEFRSHECMFYR